MEILGLLIDPRIITAIGVSILTPIMAWILKLTLAKDRREKERMRHEEKRTEDQNTQVSQLRQFYLDAQAELVRARDHLKEVIDEREAIRKEKHDQAGLHQAQVLDYERRIHQLILDSKEEAHQVELRHQAEIIELKTRIKQLEDQSRS